MTRRAMRWVRAAFHRPDTRLYESVQWVVWVLIAASVALFLVDFSLGTSYPGKELINALDRVILWFFAAEISLRILSYRPPRLDFFSHSTTSKLGHHVIDRLLFCLQPLNLIDILTVAALVPALRGLRALRLLRLLRTVKVFRYSNPFNWLERSFRENTLLFGLAFSFLISAVLLGGISLFLVEGRSNPLLASTWDGIWWALVTLTTVGYGDITPITGLGRIVGGFMMLAGMFTLALFAGVVGNTLVKSILSIREEQFRMSGYINHVVLCGYEPGAEMLLQAILSEIDSEARPLVVFAEGERPSDLPPEFVWVSGDPTKESELDKARMSHAAAAILVGSRHVLPQNADAKTVLTAFTIRSYMRRRAKTETRIRPLYVVAEILDSENVEHAYAAGADEVIETRRLGFSLLAHAVTMPGTAELMSKVAASGANSLFVGAPPKSALAEGGVSFGELGRRLKQEKGILVVGLRNKEQEDVLNPPDLYEITPGCQLIYLANSPVLKRLPRPRRKSRASLEPSP